MPIETHTSKSKQVPPNNLLRAIRDIHNIQKLSSKSSLTSFQVFSEHRIHPTMADSSKPKPCSPCNGTGKQDCHNPYCANGHDEYLKKQCPTCEGTTKAKCTPCNGSGKR
ncbi:protein SPA [Diaporthe eres]|nr:protein SPA [Diaporthe eres]